MLVITTHGTTQEEVYRELSKAYTNEISDEVKAESGRSEEGSIVCRTVLTDVTKPQRGGGPDKARCDGFPRCEMAGGSLCWFAFRGAKYEWSSRVSDV